MSDFQIPQFHEPLSRRTTEQDAQSIKTDETSLVKRLDKEVTKIGDIAFAGGMYCEVWEGEWKKGGGKGGGGENVEVEKVSLGFAIPILLIGFVGSPEGTSNTQVTREGARGSPFADRPNTTYPCLLPDR